MTAAAGDLSGESRSTGQWLSFLARATGSIGKSLDVTRIARGFAEAVVPELADCAHVYVAENLLRDDAEVPLRWTGGAMHCVASAGACEDDPVPDPLPEWLAAAKRSEVTGVDGGILVPLRVGSALLGFSVWRRRTGGFGEIEQLVGRQLAAQAALSLHNAYLYRRELTTVTVLQHGMLPDKPPKLAGVQIAHRYLPGNPEAQIGGDWFDTIRLRGGRTGLIVGDVAGHGMRSAAAMGRLRTAMRTLATLDLPPEEVLRNLDNIALAEGATIATCLYCVYDPVARQCSIANAGHIPPVLATPGQTPRRVHIPAGAPLGVGGISFRTIDVPVPDGSLLVLCTDGLLERRDRDVGEGLDALCRAVGTPASDLEKQCDSLLDAMGAPRRTDDVALVMARLLGVPAAHVANWIVMPSTRTPRVVRGMAGNALARWGMSDRADLIVLLVNELVANAIRYARRPITVRLMLSDTLLCEVHDDDHHMPVLRDPRPGDETGRGMLLVSRLSRRWGASRVAGGKVVWFEV
jgi:serine phosphatase RsbU (regulator of sigma subunit)